MAAVWLLVRCDLRRRWRSPVCVALLVGVVGAVVLTAVAGARRTDSAYPRLLDALDASHASVEVSSEYFDEIAGLPQVEAVAPASFFFVTPVGLEREGILTMAAIDDRFNRVIDRPRLLEGRRPLADRADEVLISENIADRLRLEAGDQLTLTSHTPEQLEQLIHTEDPGDPAGPEIDVTVVGVGRTQEELASDTPIVLFTPAFYALHRDDVGHFDDFLQVRLTHGEQDLAAFERGVNRVVPEGEGAIVETQAETSAEIEDATRVQAVSLVIFALAAALAGFVATGQALSRQAALSTDDQPKLHALGLSRPQRFAALLVPAVLLARVGAGAAAGVAGAAPPPASAGRVVGRLARLGAPPPVLTGVRMALEPGRGRTAVPVRSALVGAVAGVAGLVAALTFGAALGWAVTEPAAYGLTWDASLIGPRDSGGLEREASALAETDDVRAVAALSVLPIRLGGVPLQGYGLESFEGGSFVTVLDGRAPQGADEVLVGSETLDRLGRHLGDTLAAAGLQGGAPRELTIVGRGVFPEFVHPAVPDSDTGAYNDFALLTEAGNESFAAGAGGEYFSLALVRWSPGVDGSAATRRLERDGAELQVMDAPKSFVNLARVDAFPAVIAAFLVLVAAVASGHALVTSVRRRARDLALLKTLGFVGSQVRATVAWQATTLAAVGLVLGIPAGLVIGRSAWVIVARRLGIDDHILVPWLAITLAVPAALVVANVIAAIPGRRAARIRPAAVLRSE